MNDTKEIPIINGDRSVGSVRLKQFATDYLLTGLFCLMPTIVKKENKMHEVVEMALVARQEATPESRVSEKPVLERIESEIHGMLATVQNMARQQDHIFLGPDKIKALKELTKAAEADKRAKLLVGVQTECLLRIIKRYANLKLPEEVDLAGETEVEKAVNQVLEFLGI